jgi:hypothetical protein
VSEIAGKCQPFVDGACFDISIGTIKWSRQKEHTMTQITDANVGELEYQLSSLDRCDSCGAQAYIRVTMASGELYFCAHHGAKFKEKLAATALAWLDESSRLNES